MRQSIAIQDTYDSPVPMAETSAIYGMNLTPMETVLQHMFGEGRFVDLLWTTILYGRTIDAGDIWSPFH